MRYSIVVIVIIVVVIDRVIYVFVYSYVRFIYKVTDEHGSTLDCTCLMHARYTRTWEKYSNKLMRCQQTDDGRVLSLWID